MEEIAEEFLSTASDVTVRARNIINSDDIDLSTKQSQLLADMLNAITIEDDNKSIFFRWYYEICAWIPLKYKETKYFMLKTPIHVRRDDRLTGLARYAAFVSVKKVLDEVVNDISYSNGDIKSTVICIVEAVLDSFDVLCKDLLIEKSWDVTTIRESIIAAAYFTIDYMISSSNADKMCFPGTDEHCGLLLWIFQGFLIGNFGQDGEFLLRNNVSTNVVEDDIVGLSVDIQKIKDRLTGSHLKLDIIPIIGMGGIGKTTLARKVYEDPHIIPLFHVRVWIVVSQEFQERDVLLGLLESIAPIPNELYKEDTEQLGERLYRRLKGWRYFMVLDDIWTKEAWERIKLFFPNDNNGSRIVLTSRITKVASHADPENPPHFMSFLGIEDSWELLLKRVYGKDVCPRRLTNIGMQIVEKCQGLPLAIELMAGYLSKISRTQECWEDVAKRVDFPIEGTQLESLSKILFISFHDLPLQLKTCFLTLTLFPKNFEISVRKVIQMWTAMGFLCQTLTNSVKEDITLEEVAMMCFENLIDRSLIRVKKRAFDGKAKLCGVHDLLWDLSMKELYKQFSSDNDKKYANCITQAFLYFDHSFESDYSMNSTGFNQLRVLDILNQSFDHFPIEITKLVNLRYLALSTSDNIPSLIYKLSYLETLLNYHERAGQMLPAEIWLLVHLKHLHVGSCTFLCEPPSLCAEGSSNSLLPCLLSLYNLSLVSCTKEAFLNVPHLKQLGIVEHEQDDIGDELLCCVLQNLVNLHQLEKLKLCCNPILERPRFIPYWGSFLPKSIKKLTLSRSNLPWSEMKTLAMLPNLEVLKLKQYAFKGEEWVIDDEQFPNLKYLLLDSLDLVLWKANNDTFPILQHLIIRFCGSLCVIPREFGEIYTLELIDLDFYSQVSYISVIEIQREQMTLGNDKFNLRLGRTLPQFYTMGYIILFVWLTTRLNMFKPKGEDRKMMHNKASSSNKAL